MKAIKTARRAAGNLKRAKRNLRQSVTLAQAAGDVIVARTRLAANGDHREMSRMVPEKVAAFTAANIALARNGTNAATEFLLQAGQEWYAVETAARLVSRSRTPAEAFLVQCTSMWAWWERSTAQAVAFASRMMQAQYMATAPVARAAQSNVARLLARRRS